MRSVRNDLQIDVPSGETLNDRVAVVTGVSRRAGIGYAVAAELLAAGASVLVHSWPPHDAGAAMGC